MFGNFPLLELDCDESLFGLTKSPSKISMWFVHSPVQYSAVKHERTKRSTGSQTRRGCILYISFFCTTRIVDKPASQVGPIAGKGPATLQFVVTPPPLSHIHQSLKLVNLGHLALILVIVRLEW